MFPWKAVHMDLTKYVGIKYIEMYLDKKDSYGISIKLKFMIFMSKLIIC